MITIGRRKSEVELQRKEFEKRCQDAQREVINHSRPPGDEKKAWIFETVCAPSGNYVTRLKSSLFYWGAVAVLAIGIFLLSREVFVGAILVLTLAPCLLIYPLIRFFFGGKDSLAAAVITFVVEEFLKREIGKAADRSTNRKRH